MISKDNILILDKYVPNCKIHHPKYIYDIMGFNKDHNFLDRSIFSVDYHIFIPHFYCYEWLGGLDTYKYLKGMHWRISKHENKSYYNQVLGQSYPPN